MPETRAIVASCLREPSRARGRRRLSPAPGAEDVGDALARGLRRRPRRGPRGRATSAEAPGRRGRDCDAVDAQVAALKAKGTRIGAALLGLRGARVASSHRAAAALGARSLPRTASRS